MVVWIKIKELVGGLEGLKLAQKFTCNMLQLFARQALQSYELGLRMCCWRGEGWGELSDQWVQLEILQEMNMIERCCHFINLFHNF